MRPNTALALSWVYMLRISSVQGMAILKDKVPIDGGKHLVNRGIFRHDDISPPFHLFTAPGDDIHESLEVLEPEISKRWSKEMEDFAYMIQHDLQPLTNSRFCQNKDVDLHGLPYKELVPNGWDYDPMFGIDRGCDIRNGASWLGDNKHSLRRMIHYLMNATIGEDHYQRGSMEPRSVCFINYSSSLYGSPEIEAQSLGKRGICLSWSAYIHTPIPQRMIVDMVDFLTMCAQAGLGGKHRAYNLDEGEPNGFSQLYICVSDRPNNCDTAPPCLPGTYLPWKTPKEMHWVPPEPQAVDIDPRPDELHDSVGANGWRVADLNLSPDRLHELAKKIAIDPSIDLETLARGME